MVGKSVEKEKLLESEIKNIFKLLKEGKKVEGQKYELKKSLSDTKKILESICAFLNSDGGKIIIGIDEDKKEIKDVRLDKRVAFKKISDFLNSRFYPENIEQFVEYYILNISGRQIAIIEVKEYDNKPVAIKEKNKYYKVIVRKSDRNESLTPHGLISWWRAKKTFKENLEEIINRIEVLLRKRDLNIHQIELLIDEKLLSYMKKSIEEWKTFEVKEWFKKSLIFFSKYHKKFEIYTIYKDLFFKAYQERKRILGHMIESLQEILMSIWLYKENYPHRDRVVETCADILLRLGVDFLPIDKDITKDCSIVLDNVSSDFFIKKIFSRFILLGAECYNQKNVELAEEILLNIKINDEYAWDTGYYVYLIESLEYAREIQKYYNISFHPSFKNRLIDIIKLHCEEVKKDSYIPLSQKRKINKFLKYLEKEEK